MAEVWERDIRREILFRGKCILDSSLKGKWLEGCIFYDGIIEKYFIYKGHYLSEGDNVGNEGILQYVAYEVDPETVCQYTGLLDRYGKKIFLGDIINSNDTIGIVRFGKYKNGFHFGYYIEWLKCSHLRQELGFWNGISKVIGNVFDNPELIV